MKKSLCYVMSILLLFVMLAVSVIATSDTPDDKNSYTHETVSINNPFSSAHLNQAELYVYDMLALFSQTYSDFDLTQNDIAQIEVFGPYSIVNVDENEIKTLDYYFVNNDNVIGIVHVYLLDGQLHAEFGVDYANTINDYLSEGIPFCVVHTNTGIYIASDSQIETIANMVDLTNASLSMIGASHTSESSDVARINEYYDAGIFYDKLISASDLIENTQLQLHSSYLDFAMDFSVNTRSAPPTPPLVPQYEGDYNNIQKWCHNAVTASIAAAREPELYDGLTAGDVFSVYEQGLISVSYGRAKKTCELIKEYLSSSDHYTSYSTTAVTLTQFKNNIDAGHYVAAISLLQNYGTSYHVTLLYDYFVGVSGTMVRMMDPYNEYINPISYRFCSWSGTTFTFSMYGNSSYTYEMSENVLSWY